MRSQVKSVDGECECWAIDWIHRRLCLSSPSFLSPFSRLLVRSVHCQGNCTGPNLLNSKNQLKSLKRRKSTSSSPWLKKKKCLSQSGAGVVGVFLKISFSRLTIAYRRRSRRHNLSSVIRTSANDFFVVVVVVQNSGIRT